MRRKAHFISGGQKAHTENLIYKYLVELTIGPKLLTFYDATLRATFNRFTIRSNRVIKVGTKYASAHYQRLRLQVTLRSLYRRRQRYGNIVSFEV